MVLVMDRQVEFLGTGDIPPPPAMDALTRLYGNVPVFRGTMDREAVEQALSVLQQGGVLGAFPEGGNWRTGHTRPQKGRCGSAVGARHPSHRWLSVACKGH